MNSVAFSLGENKMIETGTLAPNFTLPTNGDGELALSSLQGAPVVIYFYPKDMTLGK